MNWLRNILGLTARDARIEELQERLALMEKSRDLQKLPALRIDETHNWTAADQANWRGILISPIGIKLLAVSRAAHYRMLRAASEDHFHAAQSVHCARGFEEAIKWLQILSVSADVPAQNQNTSRAHGEAQPGERDPEAELRASMSPR